MGTTYGVIESAKYGNTVEIYTSTHNVVLLSREENEKEGTKIVIDDSNVDEFLSAFQCALIEKDIFSNFLNTGGR